MLTIEDASTPRATTPVAGAERPGRGRNTHPSQLVKTATPGSPGYIEIVDFFEGIEPGTSRSPMRALARSDPTAEGVDAIAQRQRRMFRNRRASVVSVDVRPVPSGEESADSSTAERVMAVVLGNLHATARGPTDDGSDGDVQFMHTFVLERGGRGGGVGAGDEALGDSRDGPFAIVDEVFRRVDPVGDARAPGGSAAGAASLLRAAQSPPPTRGGGARAGRRDGGDDETSSVEKSPKMAKNSQTTGVDGPEDGGDSPDAAKTRKTPPADDLDESVDEADVWLTNPMYGDVPDTESNPGRRASQTDDAPNETPRAVRRAPGSAEVVPESPAINFASPNPFEDEAEGAGGGGAREGVPIRGVPERGADGAARVPDDSRRPMSPDANSIPLPSRSLLGANGANGRPGSGESRLNRVSRRYSHELEDAGTRRTLFDESPYVNRGRGNRRGIDDDDDDDEGFDDDWDGNRDGDDDGAGGGAGGGGDAEQERRARRKERSAAGPPSSRHRRRVYSSASSSPGFEPGTSGFDRAGSTAAANASPAAKRGLDARFQYDAQPWTSAEAGDGDGVPAGVTAGVTAAASPRPGPRALEPMARSPRLVTLTERSDEGSTAASMRESASVTESVVNSDSERGSTRSGRGNGVTAGVTAGGGVLSDEDDRGSLRAHPVAEDAEILDWEDVRGYPAPRPNPSAASPDPAPRSSSRVRYDGHTGQSRGHAYSRDSHHRRSRGDEYGDAVDARGSYPRSGDRFRRGPPPVRYGHRQSYDASGAFGDGGYAGVGGYSQPGSRSSSRGSARSSGRGFVSRSHVGSYGFRDGGYDRGVGPDDSFRRSSLSGSISRGGGAHNRAGSAPPSPSMGATRAREFGVRDRAPRVRLSSAAGGLRGSYRRDDYDFATGAFEFHPGPRGSAATTPSRLEEEQPPQLEDAVNYLGVLTAALHFTAAVVVFGFLLVAVYANGSAMTSLARRLDRLDVAVGGPGAKFASSAGSLGGLGGWGGGGGGGGGARMPKVGASVFGGSVVDVSGDARRRRGARRRKSWTWTRTNSERLRAS